MDIEVIKALEERAKRIWWHIGRRFGEDFHGYSWEDYDKGTLTYDLPRPGVIKFKKPNNEFADIMFEDITPTKVTRKILHDPVLLGSEKNDVNSSVITNQSDITPIERTYDLTISESKTFKEAVGVGVEVGLLQKISYGGAASPVSGETSLSFNISTTYDKEWGGENSITRETSTTIEVPPLTEATLTTENAVSNFEQTCEYWCDLEHSVRLSSHNDWSRKYSSMSELKQVASGRGDNTKEQAKEWRKKPLNDGDIAFLCEPLEIYYKELIKFDSATTGDARLSTKPYAG